MTYKINTTGMEENHIVENVSESTDYLIRTKHKSTRNLITLFGMIWYITMGLLYYFKTDVMLRLDDLQFVAIALPIIIWTGWYAYIKSKVADLFMQQFAQSNGFTYRSTGSLQNLHGTLFSIGHSKRVEDVVSGINDKHPLKLFTYEYAVGSGKSKKTYRYMVFELTFDTQLPRILLRSKSQSFGGDKFFSPSFDHPNEVKLEGNFDKYYEFGVDHQYEIEALQIFTPDFMAHLIDLQQKFSIELINNKVYVYSDVAIEQRQQLQYFYDIAKWLCQCLAPILPRMKKGVQAMDEKFKQ